jgi:ribose-phosphate pyrophosphokinase
MDDEIDTGGTITAAVDIAMKRGATSATLACVHPILSGRAVERICGDAFVEELVVTDTIPLPSEKRHEKISTLSVAPLLGEAIARIHTGRSVGELFST